jgi:hypothetical protein
MSEIIIEPFVGGVKKKPAPNPTNWQFSAHPACMATKDDTLPVAHSIKAKMPYVYKQIYGSCTANAVLSCDHYYYHTNKWHPSCTFTYHQARVLDGSGKSKKDDGSSVECALDAVRKYGACSAEVWPNEKPFYKKPSKEAYANGLKGHELTKYYQVKNLTQIKKALFKDYPVAIAVAWCFKSIDGNTWILTPPSDEDIEECYSGHAIVVVGYDDKSKLFEIRNSWSGQWGNGGYAFIDYATMKKVIWFDDSYAVVR